MTYFTSKDNAFLLSTLTTLFTLLNTNKGEVAHFSRKENTFLLNILTILFTLLNTIER